MHKGRLVMGMRKVWQVLPPFLAAAFLLYCNTPMHVEAIDSAATVEYKARKVSRRSEAVEWPTVDWRPNRKPALHLDSGRKQLCKDWNLGQECLKVEGGIDI